ncbi:MAG: methyltransferase domain-containing protein [Rhodospirillales bacterium]|nr:methyltransferase domain-containing protein [Rhodospirillales bacterium]
MKPERPEPPASPQEGEAVRPGRGAFTTRPEVRAVYQRRARHYDFAAKLYYLIGFREQAYRKMAIEALQLRRGDRVVDIGCGTGLNFAILQDKVGPKGRIIGVDLSPAMLAEARRRVTGHGWSNVELVESAAAAYLFPREIDGILSTLALTLEPDYDAVIARGAEALRPGDRWVVLDIKLPFNWLRHLAPYVIFLVRPFAVSLALAERHPWVAMERHLENTTLTELYFGFAYIASGEAL